MQRTRGLLGRPPATTSERVLERATRSRCRSFPVVASVASCHTGTHASRDLNALEPVSNNRSVGFRSKGSCLEATLLAACLREWGQAVLGLLTSVRQERLATSARQWADADLDRL